MNCFKKFPDIIITEDTLWGQPRINGRRIAVGDVVSLLNVNKNLNSALEDYELSLQEIKQALLYCKLKQCINDKPKKYCHNCSLRANQDNELLSYEKDNWEIAKMLIKKYFE